MGNKFVVLMLAFPVVVVVVVADTTTTPTSNAAAVGLVRAKEFSARELGADWLELGGEGARRRWRGSL